MKVEASTFWVDGAAATRAPTIEGNSQRRLKGPPHRSITELDGRTTTCSKSALIGTTATVVD